VLMKGAFEVDTGRFGPRRSIDFFPSSAARVAFGVNRGDVSGAEREARSKRTRAD